MRAPAFAGPLRNGSKEKASQRRGACGKQRGEQTLEAEGWGIWDSMSRTDWFNSLRIPDTVPKGTPNAFTSATCPVQRLTRFVGEAGFVELAHVELQPDDGKHDDGEEEEEPDLEQRDHRLHDRLEDNLQA